MKKIFLLLMIIALSVLPIFASEDHINVKITPVPYALQIATSEKEGDDPIFSTYGIGADISYQSNFNGEWFAEGGLSWNTYALEDKAPISSIMPYAGIGYNLMLSDMWKVVMHAGFGVDWLIYNGVSATTFTIKSGVGVTVNLSEELEASLGVDATFGFSDKGGTSYVNYRIIPTLGLGVSL